jgi:hypothetical protein
MNMEIRQRKKTISIAGKSLTFLINTFITAKESVLISMYLTPAVKTGEEVFKAGGIEYY